MLEETKKRIQHLFKSVYEKVYIVNFENSPYVPVIEQEQLNELGKWYVSTGKEWICHSDLELKDFETLFLNLLEAEVQATVVFECDYMPFQQA